jgi:acylphosphatase
MKRAVKIFISGTVQGVFFRAYVREQAEKLDVKGYVRNLPDARVEAWLEGDSEAVGEMVNLCKKGAPHSIVKNVEVQDAKFQDLKEFKILHI